MDLSLTGSQIGSSRSRGPNSNRSTRSTTSSVRNRQSKLVNAEGNVRKPLSGAAKSPNSNFMSMIDSGAKGKAKPSTPKLGNRNEVKYRSAGDLASSIQVTGAGRSNNFQAADSARTESTLQPEPIKAGTEDMIDTALCLPSLRSLDKWLENSVAVADSKDWQEIALGDSQMTLFSDNAYEELVSVSQRGQPPVAARRPTSDRHLTIQLNNSHNMGFGPGGGRPAAKVSSIENLRQKQPVNLTRTQGAPSPLAAAPDSGISNGVDSLAVRSEKERRDEVEVLIFRMNHAARMIQRWWRHNQSRRAAVKAAEAAMRRMMSSKHSSLLQQQQEEKKQLQHPTSSHQERAKAERQRAISELHLRREEKAKRQAELATKEVERLKTEGKIKPPARPRSGRQKTNKEKTTPASTPVDQGTPRAASASSTQLAEFLNKFGGDEDKESAVGSVIDVLSNSARSERTTINDICAALKQLEETESISDGNRSRRGDAEVNVEQPKPKSAWVEDIDRLLSEETSNPVTAASVNAILTSSLLKEHDQLMERMTVRPLPPDNLEHVSNQTKAAVEEVTSQVQFQRQALDDKAHEVVVLERALRQQEEQAVTNVSIVRAEMVRQMAAKQEEYQSNLQRKHDLIEQLFEQKKDLQTKCENYVSELKTIKDRYEKIVKQMQEKHEVEMQKLKEKMIAAEKIRMERWEDRKTKEIREDTVKGVASELQTLMDQQKRTRAELVEKHKREMASYRAEYEAKLVSADERAEKRYFEKVQELRDELTREKESACDRERESAKQRYESQLAIEMQALESKRRQLYSEIQEERERQATAAAKQRSELDRDRAQLEELRTQSAESLARNFDAARSDSERRHATEMRELKERLEAEKEAWIETQMKRQQAWSMAKERELKENLKKDRDRELERVIEELDKDRSSYRDEVERTAENKIRRIREKYEAENTEYERSERIALEKYNKIKAELLEVQGESEKLKVIMRQKEEEVQEIRKHYEKLNRERTKVSDVVREEFAEQILSTGEENKQLKMEMAELRARHRVEQDKLRHQNQQLQEEKEEELAAIHRRVKDAIKKKDENLQELRMQYEAAVKRAENFEHLLTQQREQLLSLKK